MTLPELYQLALNAYQKGDTAQAQIHCQALLKKHPNYAAGLHLAAVLLSSVVMDYEREGNFIKAKRAYQEALRMMRKAVADEPHNATFLTSLGTLHRISGHFYDAEQAYRKALKLNPREAIAHDGLGQTLWKLAKKDPTQKYKAEEHFKKSIEINPNLEIAYLSIASLSLELDDPQQAVTYGEQALARHPVVQIFITLGQAYSRLGQDRKAESCYQRGMTLFPKHPQCYVLYAGLLLEQGDEQAALTYACQAHALANTNENQQLKIANIYENTGDLSSARGIYEHLMARKPTPEVLYRLAANQLKQGQEQNAVQTLIEALILEQNLSKYISYIGSYFSAFAHDWDKLTQAAGILAHAPEHMPAHQQAQAYSIIRIVLLRIACNHDKFPIQDNADAETYSDYLQDMHYSPAYTREEIYAAHCRFNELFALPLANKHKSYNVLETPEKRLRVGYISQDFRTHSVAYFIEGILAAHHPDKIEVFGYYNNKHEDTLTQRFKTYCTGGWRHCFEWTDEKLANVVRHDKIDILVDLMGHAGPNRILVFARKPAPVQLSYMGYSDTTGLTAMDYRVTDGYVEPEGAERFSSECLLRMPHSYFCYRPADMASDIPVNPLPALTNVHVTFGSFNIYNKITDEHIRRWAKILARVPNSKLLLKVRLSDDFLRNFKMVITQRFASLGIAAERLIIKDYVRSLDIALQIYHDVDICLDTHPYSGATTTCESLWMGCPVVSLYGQNHVSRMSLSILSAVGLGELAVPTDAEYIASAVRLAQDYETLQTLRATLRDRMRASPLMDAVSFTRTLEQHYRAAWKKYCMSALRSDEGCCH